MAYDLNLILARAWGELDPAFSLLGLKGNAVCSTRMGLDAIIQLPSTNLLFGVTVHPALLGFFSKETITTENKVKDADVTELRYTVSLPVSAAESPGRR